ncbi:MAG TPA: hypothetical protein VGN63_14960 [Flavisolibacter sp.]|jgi:hypothetical protein|nr:hypothetical protein [Flavisolibacter sp.]
MEKKPYIKLKRTIQERPVWEEHRPLKLLVSLLFEANDNGEITVTLHQLFTWMNTYDVDRVFALLQRLKDLGEITTEIRTVISQAGRIDKHIAVTLCHYKIYVA